MEGLPSPGRMMGGKEDVRLRSHVPCESVLIISNYQVLIIIKLTKTIIIKIIIIMVMHYQHNEASLTARLLSLKGA